VRPTSCRTARVAHLEAPARFAELHDALAAPSGVHSRCLTLWASADSPIATSHANALERAKLSAFKAAPWPIIIVSNELRGAGAPEPQRADSRDLAGTLAQLSAAAANRVWLIWVAGCPLQLK